MGQVVGEPDGLRPETGAGPVGGAAVEGRAQDDGAGGAETGRVVEVGCGHAGESGVRAVHVAQPHAGEATVRIWRSPEALTRSIGRPRGARSGRALLILGSIFAEYRHF